MWWSRRGDEEPGDRLADRPAESPAASVVPTPPQGAEVVEEIEAFLQGTYAQWLVGHGRAVPVAAWLNAVAHGDDELICTLAAGDDTVPPEWREALARLARTATPEVQREILVPLELDLLRVRLTPDLRPGQLASLVEHCVEGRTSSSSGT